MQSEAFLKDQAQADKDHSTAGYPKFEILVGDHSVKKVIMNGLELPAVTSVQLFMDRDSIAEVYITFVTPPENIRVFEKTEEDNG